MSQIKNTLPSIFNPGNQTDNEIISNFVIRTKEFGELFNTIKKDKMNRPPQHFIIQGQRGYGKTTLLLRLNIEIKTNPDLSSWLVPIMFDEEQYSVRTLAKLWEEVIDILEAEHGCCKGMSDKIDPLYDTDNPEEEIFNLLMKSLESNNKKLILLLDNFGDIIGKFNEKENQRLREVLNTCNRIRLIGASSVVLEFYHEYKEPFFDFFKIVTLDELTNDETILLLKSLDETYKTGEIEKIIGKQPGRVEALRRLTGGVPRTVVMLFQIFVDDTDGNSFKDLDNILDKVTPLYKHRLDNLSTQQQAIIDAIAQNWDAISTQEISKQVRMQSKAVSSQLKQLEKAQLIRKITTSTKNYFYQINERFFNIYYLMRLGKRKNRNKILWLVKFLEIWCSQKELVARANRHLNAVKEGRVNEKCALYMTQALAKTSLPIEQQHELINETRIYLSKKDSELIKELDKSHMEVLEEIKDDILNEKYEIAKSKLKKDGIPINNIPLVIAEVLLNVGGNSNTAINFYHEAIEKDSVEAMFKLALHYHVNIKDFEKAKKYYLMAIEKQNVSAMHNLASLYLSEFKDYKNAEKFYLMAVEKGEPEAMNNLARLYFFQLKEIKKAEKYALMAIDYGNVDAMNGLGIIYMNHYNDFNKAEKYLQMAIEKGNTDSINNLAVLYNTKQKDFNKAEKCYLKAVEKGNIGSMNNLALLYKNEFKDYKRAEHYYLMAVEKDSVDAMVNLASLYQNELADFKKAEKYYLMAVEKNNSDAMFNLATLYYFQLDNFESAEKYYLMSIKKENFNSMNNLSWIYFNKRINKNNALHYIERAFDKIKDSPIAYTYVLIQLWNDHIENAIKIFKSNFISDESFIRDNKIVSFVILLFLSKKQYNFIYNLFKENKFDIRDKYKPIYYATIKLLGQDYSDEFRRMPPELNETVEEVMNEINKLAIDYA